MHRFLTAAIAAIALIFGSAAARADAFADILKNGVVRIAVPLDVPPFGSMNQERKPEGFDIDLAEMVAKALGVKVELQQVTGANRIPYLLTDKVDIVISVMGLTPERAKQDHVHRPLCRHASRGLRPQERERALRKRARVAQGRRC